MFELKQDQSVVFFNYFITDMITYLTIYIYFYLLTLVCLQYLLKTTFSNKINMTTLPQIILYISKFSNLKTTYIGLILALTGIPPFLLFFIKFNYLIEAVSRVSIVSIILIFFIFLLNMLYYIQVFIVKNVNFKIDTLVLTKKKVDYRLIFLINLLLMLYLFSILFVKDIYMFINLLI